MNVVCLEDPAFEKIIDVIIEYAQAKIQEPIDNIWVPKEVAKESLNISSDTTLQKLRDLGEIRFTYTTPKVILYDRRSIDAYLERKAIPTKYEAS